jgi:DNA-binding GntR family transcriptional regulator
MAVLVTKSLAEQVREVLRERIVSGALPPASRLELDGLAAEFGISVTPVRDAVRLLERDGLVVIQPRRGVFTAPADVRAFRDVFDARIALECLAVETAVDSIPTIELAELEAVHRAAATRLGAQPGAPGADEALILGPIDSTVHDLIVRHADNAVVRELMETLRGRIAWVRHVAADQARRYRLSFEEHREILAALRARDREAAAGALRRHLTRSRDHTLSGLAAGPAGPAGQAPGHVEVGRQPARRTGRATRPSRP